MAHTPRVTVVVPMLNEERSVRPLVEAVREVLGEADDWELLLVDDGSEDGTAAECRRAAAADPRIRPLALARNYGQTTAMQVGFDHARGEVVVTMDGDLQNDPADIPRLVSRLEEGYDIVAGYRENRKDRLLTRKVPSWVANRLIRALTGVPIRDNGCSLKAYRGALVKKLDLYSDMHRFVPAVAAGTLSGRIAEVPVRHHPRLHGRSKYGLSRVWKVLADLLTLFMIRWFGERPLAMFAWASLVSTALGVAFAVGTAVVLGGGYLPGRSALVLPGTALLWFGLAVYLLMLGLIAEVAVRERARGSARSAPAAEAA